MLFVGRLSWGIHTTQYYAHTMAALSTATLSFNRKLIFFVVHIPHLSVPLSQCARDSYRIIFIIILNKLMNLPYTFMWMFHAPYLYNVEVDTDIGHLYSISATNSKKLVCWNWSNNTHWIVDKIGIYDKGKWKFHTVYSPNKLFKRALMRQNTLITSQMVNWLSQNRKIFSNEFHRKENSENERDFSLGSKLCTLLMRRLSQPRTLSTMQLENRLENSRKRTFLTLVFHL